MAYLLRDLKEMWEQMYQAQQDKGRPLTVRDMMKLFDLQSTSAVVYRLDMLINAGFAKSVRNGKYHIYQALEPDQITGG